MQDFEREAVLFCRLASSYVTWVWMGGCWPASPVVWLLSPPSWKLYNRYVVTYHLATPLPLHLKWKWRFVILSSRSGVLIMWICFSTYWHFSTSWFFKCHLRDQSNIMTWAWVVWKAVRGWRWLFGHQIKNKHVWQEHWRDELSISVTNWSVTGCCLN